MMDFVMDLQGWEGAEKPLEGEMQVKRIGKMSRVRV